MAYDLEFEKPLADLEKKIITLQRKGDHLKADEQRQLQATEQELRQQTEQIYHNLTRWQTVQVARHKDRPYSADYIRLLCNDFFELHGDRTFGDDHAIMAGMAQLGEQTVMLVCHQKGRDMKEKQFRNLGMPHPEGYRKAARAMQQAEKFGIPIVSFIDAAGASPGLVDEERGQAEAIASILYLMPRLRVPIIAAIIGEGGSGGALAIGIADRVLMLEHSIYTVAAPEAAASIMWRNAVFAPLAAEAMHISAQDLLPMGLIDEIVPEPLGGAQRDHEQTATMLKTAVLHHLAELRQFSIDEMLERRYQKFRRMGPFGTQTTQLAAATNS
jgi:acetyl-CoA carboxylase, carboxyl transferase, alpha subunit